MRLRSKNITSPTQPPLRNDLQFLAAASLEVSIHLCLPMVGGGLGGKMLANRVQGPATQHVGVEEAGLLRLQDWRRNCER